MATKKNTVTLPIREFGDSLQISVMATPGSDIEKIAKKQLQKETREFVKLMSYLTDIHWVKKPEIKVGPQVDMLRRFQYVTWYSVIASKGYEEFEKHFEKRYRCRKQHQPEIITFNYIWNLFKLWWKVDRKVKNDLDD